MKKQLITLFTVLFMLCTAIPTIHAEAVQTSAPVDREYGITVEVLKDVADELSATSRYLDSEAKVVVENGKTYVVITELSAEWWKSLKTQATQPGAFTDSNFVEAEVLSEDLEANTRVVKFEVADLHQVLNAKIHIVVTGVPGVGTYDSKHDIRFRFVDTTSTTAPNQLKDGNYSIDVKALHETEDKDSSMSRFIKAPATLTVEGGKKVITFVLTSSDLITGFQTEQDGKFIDVKVIQEDQIEKTRTVAFTVADLSKIINAKVQVYAAAQNHTGNHALRLSFDQESIQPQESVATFDDIQNSWAKPYIEALASKKIIKGVTDSRFAPENTITRGEFAVLLSRALELPKQEYKGVFSDVTEAMEWAVYDVEAANRAGIVLGNHGKFAPNETISREQMVTMIIRAIEYKNETLLTSVSNKISFADEASIQDFAKEYVQLAVGLGIVDGMNVNGELVFAPMEKATRAQAAKVVFNLLERL